MHFSRRSSRPRRTFFAVGFAVRLVAAILATLTLAPAARAQVTEDPKNPLPDPSKFATGIYADGELGSVFFLGNARKLGVGVGFGARVGFDFFRWASVQAHLVGSTHETDFGDAPQTGQLLQFYQAMAEIKLSIPIRQVSIFAFGGGGLGYFSTNLLETVGGLLKKDTQTTLLGVAGGGLDYHTLSRHFSFGLMGGYEKLLQLVGPGGVMVTTYLRHTF